MAGAASRDNKDSKERAAKTACLAGDYAKGVALLAELYVKTNDINFLFNQGRCFEQNGKYEEAIVRFREYVRKNKDAGNAPDPDAELHLVECQALIDKQKSQAVAPPVAAPVPAPTPAAAAAAAAPAPAAAAAAPAPAPAPAPPVAVPPVATVLAPPPEPQGPPAPPASASSGVGMRIAGMAAAAVGISAIATGVILNVKANSLASELENPTSYTRSKESTRSSYQTLSWVGYGAGAACLAGGALLYYLGYRQGQATQIAFVPVAGPGQLGAILRRGF